MTSTDLERLIDHRLGQLPAPRAPETLAPRVMRAVERWSARPWYRRAWTTWPLGWHVASAVAAAVMVAGVALLLPTAYEALALRASSAAGGLVEPVSTAVDRTEVAVAATRVVWRTLVAPIVPYALGLVLVMFGACALGGTALSYLVLGKAVDR
jgi:hypothetical protein